MAKSVLTESAYTYIRNQIRAGEKMPGTLLSENELAEELNMSRTPIRAAILRLESEGLVVTLKNRGVLVKEVSMKDAMDTMELLYIFQQHALQLMKEGGEKPDLKRLKDILNLQLKAEKNNDYLVYLENAMEFISCFTRVLNNQAITKIVEASVEKLVFYGSINYKRTPHEPHYSANPQNLLICEKLEAEDYDGLNKILIDSYNWNQQRMLRIATH